MQARESQPLQFPALAALPKTIQPLRVETLGAGIPELKMQFERQRHLGIVQYALPNPARLSDHRRQVIDGMFVAFPDRFIPQLRRNLLGAPNLIGWKKKIQIALSAVSRIANE
jgi:hypothetical protein